MTMTTAIGERRYGNRLKGIYENEDGTVIHIEKPTLINAPLQYTSNASTTYLDPVDIYNAQNLQYHIPDPVTGLPTTIQFTQIAAQLQTINLLNPNSLIARIVKVNGVWNYQLKNKEYIPIHQNDSSFLLETGFVCDELYDGPNFVTDGLNLKTCSAQTLSNLTWNGLVRILNIPRLVLTNEDMGSQININIVDTQPVQLYLDDDNYNQQNQIFYITGNATLILKNVIRGVQQFDFKAQNIQVTNLSVNATDFKNMVNQNITRIQLDSQQRLWFFNGLSPQNVAFQQIENISNNLITYPNNITSQIYTNGWII